MEYWTVPRMWVGETVAVLASGPSMSKEVTDLVRRAGIPAIAVNNTYQLAPWAEMLYAADYQWWNEHRDAFDFDGLKVTIGTETPRIHRLERTGNEGFDPNPSCLRTGSNSGYQAIHIAAHAGASRILLCGMDMRGGHWHGAHPEPLKNASKEHYEFWAERKFSSLKTALDARDVKILNCTPDSAIKDFEFANLKDILRPYTS